MMNKSSAWLYLVVGAVLIYLFLGYHGTVGIDLSGVSVGGQRPSTPTPPTVTPSSTPEQAALALAAVSETGFLIAPPPFVVPRGCPGTGMLC